jgi:hypothetical protein
MMFNSAFASAMEAPMFARMAPKSAVTEVALGGNRAAKARSALGAAVAPEAPMFARMEAKAVLGGNRAVKARSALGSATAAALKTLIKNETAFRAKTTAETLTTTIVKRSSIFAAATTKGATMLKTTTKAIVLAMALSAPSMAQDNSKEVSNQREALQYAQSEAIVSDQTDTDQIAGAATNEANRTIGEVETLGEITITDTAGGGTRSY